MTTFQLPALLIASQPVLIWGLSAFDGIKSGLSENRFALFRAHFVHAALILCDPGPPSFHRQ
jgi:hypothetical protein